MLQLTLYCTQALNKDVYLAEIERDISKEVYGNLKDFKIEMPHVSNANLLLLHYLSTLLMKALYTKIRRITSVVVA